MWLLMQMYTVSSVQNYLHDSQHLHCMARDHLVTGGWQILVLMSLVVNEDCSPLGSSGCAMDAFLIIFHAQFSFYVADFLLAMSVGAS